jgi:hypothetical protein
LIEAAEVSQAESPIIVKDAASNVGSRYFFIKTPCP